MSSTPKHTKSAESSEHSRDKPEEPDKPSFTTGASTSKFPKLFADQPQETKPFKIKTYNKAVFDEDGKSLKPSNSTARPIHAKGIANQFEQGKDPLDLPPKGELKTIASKNVVIAYEAGNEKAARCEVEVPADPAAQVTRCLSWPARVSAAA